ncbi:MAG: hypothetical protein M1838_003439 [Thelocarpon superellum]|nr:MAG: hypothetical protein M1838_003439 [Thelocarpon superellum]
MAHAAFLPKIICAHRVNQTFTELSVVDEQAAIAAELSPETLAPSFVILDYTAGQAVGGAYGSFALQVVHNGVTAPGRAVAWQAANASASVAVLPLAAADTTYQAGLTDARRMIQHVMFGNPDSTGNERCRAGINGQPGRPDCVVLYGPGVLARSFGWELFDAVVFLLAFNDGFPMSIPDMASAFYVASSGTDDTTTSKHAAVISCRPVEPCSDVTKCTAPAVAHQCDFPRFSVQRELINVPDLNQTAAQRTSQAASIQATMLRSWGDPSRFNAVSLRRRWR